MSAPNVLKLRLSLMGRPVRNYTFDKNVVSIGRDPNSDVFVDNPGVSRDHFRLERQPNGEYRVLDLGSANGTFLNDQMVNTAVVHNNDVVRFGKYTLWVGYDIDRRAAAAEAHEARRSGADTHQHTVILSRSELGSLLEVQKEKEQAPSPPSPAPDLAPLPGAVSARPSSAGAPIGALVTGFVLGLAAGAGAVWILLHR